MKHLMRGIVVSLLCAVSFIFSVPAHGKFISRARMMGIPEKFYESYISPLDKKEQIDSKVTISSHAGTYREIGQSQARHLLSVYPDYKERLLERLKSLLPEDSAVFTNDTAAIKQKLGAFFPEYIEEIAGFAEVLGLDIDTALRIYSFQYPARYGGCSIVAVAGKKTADGKILIGRNYDWIPSLSDMRYVYTAPAGGYRSVGASEYILGRADGINEEGLFIAMAGSAARRTNDGGFMHPVIVRAVLDRARSVDEALAIIRSIPASTSCNLLVADREGNAAAVEIIPGRAATVRRLADDPDSLLVVTNHFQNRGMARRNSYAMPNSYERARIIRRMLKKAKNVVGDDIMKILNSTRPSGVRMEHYGQLMGTIYSGIFSPENASVTAKFGAQDIAVGIQNPPGDRVVSVRYQNRKDNLNDFISREGSRPDDIDSLAIRGTLITYYSKNVLNPGAMIDCSFKKGIGTDTTYGHQIKFSLFAMGSFSLTKIGVGVSYDPVPFFSLGVKGFYLFYYKNIIPTGGPYISKTDRILRKINTISENYRTPGVTASATFRLMRFIEFENGVTFYDMKERGYEYDSNMLVRKGPIWSSRLDLIIPYSRRFLWGLSARSNVEFLMKHYRWDPPLHDRYNIQIGPVLIFPDLVTNLTLYIYTGGWAKLSAGMDTGHWSERVFFLAALQGRY